MNSRGVVVFLLLSLGCATLPSEYSVRGSCASGVPNGDYALVLPNGRTELTGAFLQGKKDGVFTLYRSSGEKVAAIPYREDQIDGTVELWYGPESGAGQRKLTATYTSGVLDGSKLSWYPGGSRRGVFHYTAGQLDAAEAWAPDGSVASPSAAIKLASADEDADRSYYDVIENAIRENLPRCP